MPQWYSLLLPFYEIRFLSMSDLQWPPPRRIEIRNYRYEFWRERIILGQIQVRLERGAEAYIYHNRRDVGLTLACNDQPGEG
jgi:hypothetical protein